MSVRVYCDMCGAPLAEPSLFGATATVQVNLLHGHHTDGYRPDAWERHLCAGDRDDPESCLRKALDLFDTALAAAPALASLQTTGPPPPATTVHACDVELDLAEVERNRRAMSSDGGICTLGIPLVVQRPLRDAGILTIAEVQRRIADGSISAVNGLGPSRLQALAETIARWERNHQVGHRR